MDLRIFYAGRFTRPEKVTQYLTHFMLCLITDGFEYMRFSFRGTPALPQVAIDSTGGFLMLIPPEVTLDFSAGKKRENFVAMLELPDIEYAPSSLSSFLNGVPLVPVKKLSPAEMCALSKTFSGIVENVSGGDPGGAEKAKLRICALLAELVADTTFSAKRSPAAEAMKNAIDADTMFKYSVKELNDRLGYCSLPYMRKLFFKEYGILPGKYRNNRRMNKIMELFAQSDFSLKMIAHEVGMKHLTHLYAFLRNDQHLSPKELLEQIRGRQKH